MSFAFWAGVARKPAFLACASFLAYWRYLALNACAFFSTVGHLCTSFNYQVIYCYLYASG